MKYLRTITTCLLSSLFATIMSQSTQPNTCTRQNPFLTEYKTPFGTIPFDKIINADYLPAMREGMKLQKKEVEAIAMNPDAPTFDNTIVALERSGRVLSRVELAFYNLLSADTNDTLQSIAETIAPEESEHSNSIYLNEQLFNRVKAVYEMRKKLTLTPEQSMLLEDMYESFQNHGATLTGDNKEKYKEYSRDLQLAQLQFGQNVLKATNDFELNITDKAQLAGIPADVLEAANAKAKSKGNEGWIFDLSYPSYVPFMKYADNRPLRQKMYMAYNTKAFGGEFDNQQLVANIVNLRLKIANLLGYRDYAAYVLRDRMAENEKNVYKLLDQLLDAYKPVAEKEISDIQSFADAQKAGYTIMPWDWSYFSNKFKEQRFDLNDEQVKPYFELERVKKGVFGLATRLYGLQFKKNPDIPVYNKEVEAFEVYDADGKFLSILYTDFHPRAGKQGGAWMTEFKNQYNENGIDSRPQISLVMNFSRPTPSQPALLTFDELTTFLHEFGHSLHGMMADGTYESLTGTNVYRDFVEMPSQLMENWATQKEFLDTFAENYKTGEKMPDSLVQKIKDAANFNVGYACLRQLSFGYLDMAWHTQRHEFKGDVRDFEQAAWAKAKTLLAVDGTCMSVQFSHIFDGGYAAGYYGYKWAEVLDADVFSVFQKNGIFDKATATSFRNNILSKGASEHPMILYKRFRGQTPTIDALLRRNGIKK